MFLSLILVFVLSSRASSFSPPVRASPLVLLSLPSSPSPFLAFHALVVFSSGVFVSCVGSPRADVDLECDRGGVLRSALDIAEDAGAGAAIMRVLHRFRATSLGGFLYEQRGSRR